MASARRTGRSDRIDPDANLPQGVSGETQTRYMNEGEAAQTAAEHQLNATDAAALDETMTMGEADARRETPRMRTDSANPRKARSFPSATDPRPSLSSRRKKEYSSTKREWVQHLPGSRRRVVNALTSDRQNWEDTNSMLRAVNGTRSELDPRVEKFVSTTDRAIQDFERTNEREHLVYAVMRPPRDHGNSRNALMRHLRSRAEDAESEPFTYDSYIPADHTMGNVDPGRNGVVMEIRTRSGAYLGTSDSTPDASHIIGRGRDLRVVGVQENVPYEDSDGTIRYRTVVQMDDVTDDGRTTARR